MTIVIGMGGGYDIVAAYMLTATFANEHDEFENVDIGGFLNPKFRHVYRQEDGQYDEEKAINLVRDAKKYRISNGKSVSFIDSFLAQHVPNTVYNFSIHDIRAVVNFLSTHYTRIIFCDVGGDVLFSGEKDNMVKTPLIDAFALKIAQELDKRVSVGVMLLGLGFDGELPYANIKYNMERLYRINAITNVWEMNRRSIIELEKIYYTIRELGKGKTIQLLIDTWYGRVTNADIFEKRRIRDFTEWYNKGYCVSPSHLSEINPLCVESDFLSMFQQAKRLGVSMRRYI